MREAFISVSVLRGALPATASARRRRRVLACRSPVLLGLPSGAVTVSGMWLALLTLLAASAAGYVLAPWSTVAAVALASWAGDVAGAAVETVTSSPQVVDAVALTVACLAPGLLTLLAVAVAQATSAARIVVLVVVGVVAGFSLVSGAGPGGLVVVAVVAGCVLLGLFAARLAGLAALFAAGFVATGWVLALWTTDRFANEVHALVGVGDPSWWRLLALAAAVAPLALAFRSVLGVASAGRG